MLVASAAALERWFDICPDSEAMVHAWARTTVKFDAPCDTVKDEMLARISGKNWTDPHNSGAYALTFLSPFSVAAMRTTGDGKYTDRLAFAFEETKKTCEVQGCSASQVTSVIDMSTNYCNLYNLYCGSNVGCPVALTDLRAIPLDKKTSLGAGSDKFKCNTGPKRELQC